MKARFAATAKHDTTGAVETILVEVDVPAADAALAFVVTSIGDALRRFNNGPWGVVHVDTQLTHCPPGYFGTQQQEGGI